MWQWFGFQYSGAKDTLIKQDSEVEELRRYTSEELRDAIAKNTDMFTPWTIRAFNYFQ